MLFQTILVGVDGSPPSRRAVETAVTLAKRDKARLLFVSVVPFPEDLLDRALHWRIQKGFSQALDAALGLARRKGVRATPMLLDGRPAEQLLWISKKSKADLVVVGSWGTSLAARTVRVLVGHVARELVDRGHCAVLVVR